MRRFLILVLLMFISTGAFAVEGVLEGNEIVVVWRDANSFNEGIGLLGAGVHRSNPSLLMPLISCIAPTGTRAIHTSFNGWLSPTQNILVIEGEHSGCRGTVGLREFKMKEEATSPPKNDNGLSPPKNGGTTPPPLTLEEQQEYANTHGIAPKVKRPLSPTEVQCRTSRGWERCPDSAMSPATGAR
jgi:hypothetical protein